MQRRVEESQQQGRVVFTSDAGSALAEILRREGNPGVFVVTDSNTAVYCRPLLSIPGECGHIVIPAGEANKNIDVLQTLWQAVLASHVKRGDCVVNIGGGVVTDLGGFAAATYMRGLRYINLPTTLLAAVDAASGGKTAVDFGGIKNLVGAFHTPVATVVSARWLRTLPREEILSGYAEMLKHALLDSRQHLEALLGADFDAAGDDERLRLMERSEGVKRRIVATDPLEKGMRRVLNLGHTCGHALEALCLKKGVAVSHGHAVAMGMLAELAVYGRFPAGLYERLWREIHSRYAPVQLSDDDVPMLASLMAVDKKNSSADSSRADYVGLRDCGETDPYACADTLTLARAVKNAACGRPFPPTALFNSNR